MTAKATALGTTDQVLPPVPMFGGREMAAAFAAYQNLQRTLDSAMPDQIIKLGGRPFRRKGYWRGIATAFNLSLELVDERREVHGLFEDGRDNFVFFVVYKATTPTGRAAIGDGSCAALEKASRTERNKWAVLPFQATEHNVRSHAHTRAFNRAVSNLVGFGEVSAEELERDDEHEPSPPAVELPPPVRSPRYQDPDAKPITEPQRRKLFASAKEKWPDTDALKAALYEAFGIESTKDLRMGDFKQALAIVGRGPRAVEPGPEVP